MQWLLLQNGNTFLLVLNYTCDTCGLSAFFELNVHQLHAANWTGTQSLLAPISAAQFAPSWAWKTFKSHAATTLILFLFSLCSFGLKMTVPVSDFRERVGAVLAKAPRYAWAQVHLKSDLFAPCPCTTYGPSPFLEAQTQKLELVCCVKPVNYLASTGNIYAVLLSGHCLFKTMISNNMKICRIYPPLYAAGEHWKNSRGRV